VKKYIGTDIHYLGAIPAQESMRSAVTAQSPVATLGDADPACREFTQLAQSLVASGENLPASRSFSAYWQRQVTLQRGPNAQNSLAEPARQSVPGAVDVSDCAGDLDQIGRQLLALVKRPQADTQGLKAVFGSSLSAFHRRHGELPVDLPGLASELIEAGDETALAQLAAVLEPWLRQPSISLPPLVDTVATAGVDKAPKAPSSTAPALSPATLAQTPRAPQCSSEDEQRAPSRGYCRPHHFDGSRFGSQQQLLQLLRSQDTGEQSLEALLATLS
jgi:hypothetical protein